MNINCTHIFGLMYVQEEDTLTLCHIETLELDGLCVVDHGRQVRVDVGGGANVGVLSYQSLF